MSDQPQAGHGRHPTFKQYVVVAIILFIITAIEFVIIFPEYRLGPVTVPTLIILSMVKFAIVIFFYMHLKFDPKLFTWIFLGGLALGTVVTFSLLFLFTATSATPKQRAFAEANAVPYAHDGEEQKSSSDTPPETGDRPTAEPTPDPVALGQKIFTGAVADGAGGCTVCHTIEGISNGMVGPDLTHIGTNASSRKDVSAKDYLIESIRSPEAFVAEGVERAIPGLMITAVTVHLTDQQVEALVQFLLAQQ